VLALSVRPSERDARAASAGVDTAPVGPRDLRDGAEQRDMGAGVVVEAGARAIAPMLPRLDFADFVFICNLPDPFVVSQRI
jgi:hypothetical protein